MIERYLTTAVLCVLALAAPVQAKTVAQGPIDPQATQEARALFQNLRGLAESKLLFGHQDATAYGVGWFAESGRSDVKSVTGSYPAVYGWDIGRLGREKNLDGVDFDVQKEMIRQAHERGGINTISWHMGNPVTGRGYLDRRSRANAVPNVIPGGSHHHELRRRLDLFVEFLDELRDKTGHPIPVIFRPWHENNQRRFWWAVRGDGADYVKLWRFTVEYLRDAKGVHNLLYAYSPLTQGSQKSTFTTEQSGYPGDAFVDIIGIDDYTGRGDSVAASARLAVEIAEPRGKIAALTEVGPGSGLPSYRATHFFTRHLLEPLKKDEVAGRISYALVWRNSSSGHFWVPTPGHPDAEDLRKFRQDPWTVFENDLPNVYKTPRVFQE